MPLQPDEKPVGRRFDGLDDAVRGQGADNETRRGLFDRLMMRAVYAHGSLFDNPAEDAVRDNRNRVRQSGSRFGLAMRQRVVGLRWNVLKEASAAGHVHGLHAAADSKHRNSRSCRQSGEIEIEIGPPGRHDFKWVLLALAVMSRMKVRAASGEEEPVDVGQQAPSGPAIGNKRQNDRYAAEFFDGSYVAGPQKVGGLSSAHIFAVTGIEVRCYPDDRLHIIESVPIA